MSFDPSLPTARDRMRFTLGDVAVPELRADEQYDALLVQYDERTATMKMAESLASEYAQEPTSVTVPGMSVSFGTLVSNWQKIADSLRTAIANDPTAKSTMTTIRTERLESDGQSEYRRPIDWIPDGWDW